MKNLLREKISLNNRWHFLENPPEGIIPATQTSAYISAKTERLKWGPGAFTHIDFPAYWSFEKEIPGEKWKYVDIPHDYIISQTPDPDKSGAWGFFDYHPAWYRKKFLLDPEDENRDLSIYFEGITGSCDIYLNGCFLKHHEAGYVPFEVNISDLARYDRKNVLAVYVKPQVNDGWWYAGGGIFRNVWLIKTDPVAAAPRSVFLPVRRLTTGNWAVPVELAVGNREFYQVPLKISCEILDPAGQIVAGSTFSGSVDARSTVRLTDDSITLDSPRLWDVDAPQLYTARISICRGDSGEFLLCDVVEQRFGFRESYFDAEKGFFLNGRPLKIKGVCMHGDFGLTGKAVPDNIARYKVSLCREMGCNALRCSHYPQQEALMDACDELGILVMAENRRFESCDDTLEHMATLVMRDRNHPSVFLWSTGNEEMAYHTMEQGRKIQRSLAHVAKTLDPTRPVTAAITNLETAVLCDDCDVVGVNYSFRELDAVRQQHPDKPFFSSENSAAGTGRSWYYGNSAVHGYLDSRDQEPPEGKFQVFSREGTWKYIMQRQWMAGGFQWIAVDHRGEAFWPRVCSASGAIDLFLQKKDAFYQNQSFFLEKPMIHLLPHWNHPGMQGRPIPVWVYTTCDEVELLLNGTSCGRRKTEKYTHLEWAIPYEPGKIEARGFVNGIPVVSDSHVTTGQPVSLALTPMIENVRSGGGELALFVCTALDADGMEVPDAEMTVSFDCQCGTVIASGSAITDHTPVTLPDRRMYAGRITVAVKPDAGAEKLTLLARSSGMQTAFLDFSLQA